MKKPMQIKNSRDYREALARLDRLKPALDQASRSLEGAMNRASRTEAVKQYASRQMRVMPAMTEPEFDKIALQVAAEGEIPEALMDRLRKGAPPVSMTDSDHATMAEELNDAARSVELFKRAIQLMEREVLREKNLAIAQVWNAVRGERERIAQKIAGAAVELAAAVSEENAFVDALRADDEAIVKVIRPEPFPVALHSDSAVCRWVAAALGISEAAAHARMGNSAADAARIGKVQ